MFEEQSNKSEVQEQLTKVCNKCGKLLPVEKFRIVRGQFHNPYYLGQCKDCEYKYQRRYLEEKNEIKFSDDLEILIERKYKTIKPERILDISGLNIIPLGTDEIFIKLMDYKDSWLSNYGRVLRYSNGKYKLLQGGYDKYGALKYSLPKNVCIDGKWTYKNYAVYAAKAVVEEFVVNPDKENNVYIWHSGYDKDDYYYRNLYPLNKEQYRIVKMYFKKTGNDTEDFIVKVMNDIRFKPDSWSKRYLKPIMGGVGYCGTDVEDCKCESYIRWHDMLSRCYNSKFHEKQPQYKDCTVCDEWLNYSNFKVWYDANKVDGDYDLDKDILFKGNKEYSPATAVFVPHAINTLFLNDKKSRGDFPIGVHYDKSKSKYRAGMSFNGKPIKIGWFDDPISAFNAYKDYKERFIRDIAEKQKGKIPHKAYEAMMNWTIEITD